VQTLPAVGGSILAVVGAVVADASGAIGGEVVESHEPAVAGCFLEGATGGIPAGLVAEGALVNDSFEGAAHVDGSHCQLDALCCSGWYVSCRGMVVPTVAGVEVYMMRKFVG
jgi:hypothetical protein